MNKFCRFLSNGNAYIHHGNLQVLPCCWFKGSADQDFSNITDWTDACIDCKDQEDSGHRSLRQTSFETLTEHGISVEINLDMTCNAACLSCTSDDSTLWQKELTKFDPCNEFKPVTPNEINSIIDQLCTNVDLTKVEYIKIWGGEPLVTDTHLKLISRIPHPENVVLHYTTNGSVFPSIEVQEAWKNFKLVMFVASIDGINEQFNYLRWPLTWNKVSSNLTRLRELGLNNLMFRIEFTLGLLNALSYKQVHQWVQENLKDNKLGDLTEINIHPCFGKIGIHKTTPEMFALIEQVYGPNHKIPLMVKHFYNNETLTDFFAHTDTWDTIRDNSWEEAFPEINFIKNAKNC